MIRNLFDDVQATIDSSCSQTSSSLESTSGMCNTVHGQCPKCKGQMTKASILGNEQVHYCTQCRVSSPILQE